MLEPAPLTRRRALSVLVGAAAAGAAALAGCSSDSSEDGAADTPGAPDANGDPGLAAGPPEGAEGIVMYASPSCGCCGQYAEYLGSEGYAVEVERTDEVDAIRTDAGVPDEAAGCHTTIFGDYVVEGHVPAEAIDRLMRDRPAVDGISLPGMPNGSPGMGGAKEAPFEIVAFAGGRVRPFMTV
jgi:hypothetical protein